MYLDESRKADLKDIDTELKKNISNVRRQSLLKTKNNILHMAENKKLAEIRQEMTNALKQGDKQTVEKLNKRSLEITRGQY